MAHETLTDLLTAIGRGEAGAYDRAFERLYDQLRALAHGQRRRWPAGGTLDTTALVHEAYLKLAAADGLAVDNRRHFLAIASRAMRQLLCNHARDRRRLKRGGPLRRTAAEPDEYAAEPFEHDLETLISLDDALARLEHEDERLARVVECRFFAGLSIPDTAEALGTSPATVKRDWALARSWLYRELGGDGREPGNDAVS
jgi:RNA polymerase sigma factor (TIGR02999 family)